MRLPCRFGIRDRWRWRGGATGDEEKIKKRNEERKIRRFHRRMIEQEWEKYNTFPFSSLLKKSEKHSNPSFRRKPGEAEFSRTYLTYVRAAERVQRVWLHPGQQQHINELLSLISWTPAFAGVTKHSSTNC